jgi:hypothetical protein
LTVPAGVALPGKENSRKGLDDMATVLHNLASLLLMQRRRTKRCRVVEVGAARERIDL